MTGIIVVLEAQLSKLCMASDGSLNEQLYILYFLGRQDSLLAFDAHIYIITFEICTQNKCLVVMLTVGTITTTCNIREKGWGRTISLECD